mgnify:CR=1 FL=1
MTNRYDLIKIQEKLQKKLTPDRYQHTLGVMYTCAALAMCHGCNLERDQIAGRLNRLCKMYTKR